MKAKYTIFNSNKSFLHSQDLSHPGEGLASGQRCQFTSLKGEGFWYDLLKRGGRASSHFPHSSSLSTHSPFSSQLMQMASNEPRGEKKTCLLLVSWAELVLQGVKPVPERMQEEESGEGSCGQGMVLARCCSSAAAAASSWCIGWAASPTLALVSATQEVTDTSRGHFSPPLFRPVSTYFLPWC